MGKLIVIEGLDGSGKATQTALLADYLVEKGEDFKQISFPDYESASSSLIKMYLSGEFGKMPEDVNPYAASLFYAVDRYASFKKNWQKYYENGGLIICDRYSTSNAVHQCAKLPEDKWEEYTAWLYETEFEKMKIPKPDLVIFLDVLPCVSQKLMLERYGGLEEKKDIHEKNIEYQEKCRKSALWCCENLGWKRIVANDGGNMRERHEISEEINKIVCDIL